MRYEFNVYEAELEGRSFWVAESKELKGCVGQGKTREEALCELEANEYIWLTTAKEYGIKIPK